jgi:outer membrane protein OmpA-like peptidoglycan-associated protein
MKKAKILAICFVMAFLAGCASQKQNQDISIDQTSRGVEILSSNSILFDSGKYQIKPDGLAFIQQVANLLKTKTKNDVLIEGYTDNVGSVELNQQLSELRALTVMKALVDNGIDKRRIKPRGFGMSNPIANNDTESGRQRNRRTDIIILGERKENLGNSPFDNILGSIKKLFG